jgi:autotransporter-associated beta strand protein
VTDLTTQTQFTLGTGGGVIDNNGFNTTLSGLVTAGTSNTVTGITGTGSLTSTGTGTLILSGLNTYSGDTIVSSGTLTLEQVNASNEASTISIASAAVLNLNFVGTDTVNKLFLNGVQQPAGVYGSGNSGGQITGAGTLTVSSGPAGGFTSWIAGFSVGGQNQPADDPDNDGVNNLLEFVLNGNPTVSDNSILPALNVTATDFEFSYQRRDDSVSPETSQSFQWGTNLLDWPGSVLVPATSATVGVATIVVSAGVPDDATTDTVKISIPKTEAGSYGQLFGRQQVVKP